VFILYAIPIGIVIGLLAGGRLERLGDLRLRWVPLMLLGLVVQLAIFMDPIAGQVEAWTPALYVASTAVVLVAVLRNLRVPGVAVVAVGAACNLAAIVANGGWMPSDPEALASIGGGGSGPSNGIVLADPALRPLTDIFALPPWLPFTNVFSVGDVLIGIGIAATIVLAMRTVASVSAETSPKEGTPA
jgi:hypothetical protein